VAAVIVDESKLSYLESSHALIIRDVIPIEKLDEFEEFHASDLYWGKKVFRDVPPERREYAIRELLVALSLAESSILFGAVNKTTPGFAMPEQPSPLDAAFMVCLEGVERLMRERAEGQICMVIADETGSKADKAALRKSFRRFRPHYKLPGDAARRDHFHDEVLFSNSADSTGIQLADTCALLINHHLKDDRHSESLFEEIRERIVYSRVIGSRRLEEP